MSTPEQPLTRKQLRELERTGALPVQGAEAPEKAAEPAVPAAPLPRAAEPVAPTPTPIPDASVDLGAAPLTRRQARQQERIRTASVPVITPDIAAARTEPPAVIETVPGVDGTTGPDDAAPPVDVHEAQNPAEAAPVAAESSEWSEESATPAEESSDEVPADGEAVASPAEVEDIVDAEAEQAIDAEPVVEAEDHAEAEAEAEAEDVEFVEAEAAVDAAEVAEAEVAIEEAPESETDGTVVEPSADSQSGAPQSASETVVEADDASEAIVLEEVAEQAEAPSESEPAQPVTVGPQFGAALLAGEPEIEAVDLPPSFDELIARNASSATTATPSALILSQAPAAPSLAGPITATGEVIITGSYRLPEGLGSAGVDPRAADGKDVDAVLIDGELPASSSPTPIAASAAISTVRGADEIIRPPAPEKGNKVILSLAITAGVLAVAVIAVLVVALTNGVFS